MSRPAGLSDEDESDDDFSYVTSANDAGKRNGHGNKVNGAAASAATVPFHRQSVGSAPRSEDLLMAVTHAKLDTVKSLLNNGLSVDSRLKNGWSPLMFACTQSSLPVIKYLIDQEANVNYQHDGFTALMALCCSSHHGDADSCLAIEMLLAAGADPQPADRHRCSALLHASRAGKRESVARLLRAGADSDKQDTMGWTAMMHASSRGFGHVVRALLESGADVNKYNICGQTAADLAEAQGFHVIADLLNKAAGGSADLSQLPEQEPAPVKRQQASVCGELEMALFGMELQHLIPLFHSHNVNFTSFLRLDSADLDRMGINKVGERNRLLDGVKDIHTQEWERSSLPTLHYRKYLTCPDTVGLVMNVSQHIKLIHASIGYVRDQLQEHPDILELSQDTADVSSLSNSTQETMKHLRGLYQELKLLDKQLNKAYMGTCQNAQGVPRKKKVGNPCAKPKQPNNPAQPSAEKFGVAYNHRQ